VSIALRDDCPEQEITLRTNIVSVIGRVVSSAGDTMKTGLVLTFSSFRFPELSIASEFFST